MKDVLVFITCPFCGTVPVPNDIREFCIEKDQINYMQKAYKDLDIQFLPNNIVEELNQN
jgi:hypothetical protein